MDRLNVGGPSKHAVWLTAGLPRSRFETTLVVGHVAEGEGDMTYFAHQHGVQPVVINQLSRELSLQDLIVVTKLVAWMFRSRPDIVHTHKAKAGATGRTAALVYKWLTPGAILLRPRNVRVVHTFHGHVFHGYYGPFKSRVFLGIERALARVVSDRIVTVSPRQRAEILGRYRVGRPEQHRVVPLGIDVGEACGQPRHDLRHEYGVPPARFMVGTAGRLCEVKNHDLLLEAFARLLEGGCDAALFIVGDGHLRQNLEARARALKIAHAVVFTGFRTDALALCEQFDVVALSSVNEGTPLTLIEAMSRGRAVASTLVGGVGDIMGGQCESDTGFDVRGHGVTCAPGDADALANAMRYLLERPKLRAQMGARGRRFVEERLSLARLIEDMAGLYDELMARDARRPAPTA